MYLLFSMSGGLPISALGSTIFTSGAAHVFCFCWRLRDLVTGNLVLEDILRWVVILFVSGCSFWSVCSESSLVVGYLCTCIRVRVIIILFFCGRSEGVIEALYILIISSVSMTVCFFFQWHMFCKFCIVVGRLLFSYRNRDCIVVFLFIIIIIVTFTFFISFTNGLVSLLLTNYLDLVGDFHQ